VNEIVGGKDDIAVVGLGCLFPGAPDVATFWRNIVAKRSSITNAPPEAWDDSIYYDPTSAENDRVYCRKGGFLGPLAYFDPVEHGIMPRAVEGGEPDQWLALRVAREALLDAGLPERVPHPERAALILGKGTYANRGTISVVYHGLVVDYTLQLLKSIHPELTADDLQAIRLDLKRRLPRFDVESAPSLIPNVTVGRIANRLDIMGPSYTIDAACASSLVAMDIAVKGLRHREYDLAIVGGVQAATPVPVLSLFCRLKALSLTETIRPFDKDADGTILSEGVGMAVLKRREDAERDGDRIYAFIRGVGVASDGRAVGVLAPRLEGEVLALRQAYADARVSPRSVGLVEAHGTATLVGDATEVESLGQVFGERDGRARCALGSVKSMIGHTMPAAGMAGFIKTALALYHKVLPPTIGVTEPSPRLEIERTPFYINTETRPWVHGRPDPRRAGVNSFGFGGINAHVVLEEAPTSPAYVSHDPAWESEVVLIAAATRAGLIDAAREVIDVVRRAPSLPLADLAFSINATFVERVSRDVTLGLVATSVEDLARKLERALARLSDPACRRIRDVGGLYFTETPLAREGKVAFLFPGEGSQYLGMLADLCREFPVVRRCFDAMDRYFAADARGFVLSDLVFPPPAFSEAERLAAERRLWEMDIAVEAVYTANQAIHQLLTEFKIRPDVLLGHSTGEYSAMRAADMLDNDAQERRAHELHQLHGGATAEGKVPLEARLIAVGASRDRVEAACAPLGEAVCVAMDNCRHQVVVVAPAPVADKAEAIFTAEGFLYESLSFDRPYHTPFFADFAENLRGFGDKLIVREPATPLYSATTAALFPDDVAEIRRIAHDHWLKPVEFCKTIERMHDDGVRLFVEVGPRGNLTAFVDDILAGRSFAAIAANVTRRSGLTQLNHLLAQLASHGVPFDLAPLYATRRLTRIDFAAPVDPGEPRRPLGRIKIPTGAPDMRLSPELAALVRTRAQGRSPVVPPPVAGATASAPVAGGAVAPAPTMSVESSSPLVDPGPASADRAPSVLAMPTMTGLDIAGTPAGGAVMSAFLGTMQQFLGFEHELMSTALGVSAVIDEPGRAALAFIDQVSELRTGEQAVASCTLDLTRFPCLRDHTLGRQVSETHPELPALPIVPFTMLAEVMAQAASLVLPDAVLVGMRAVRVHRWVGLDEGPVTIEMRAHRTDEGVAVQIVEVGGATRAPIADGVMVFDAAYPPAPAAASTHIESAEAYRWSPAELYQEAMFHGPMFQGVRAMDAVGPHGARASLDVLDRTALVAPGFPSGLVTDFVLLDLPGQVVGFWASQFFATRSLVLPFHMAALDLYGPLPEPGSSLRCVARIEPVGEDRVRAVLDVVRADGTLYARFEGWEDRRFDLPDRVRRVLVGGTEMLSEPWRPTPDGFGVGATRRLGVDMFPDGWLSAHGGLWRHLLAANVLGPAEREAWASLALPDDRALEWLLGRIAAKDAVREYVRETTGLSVRPADVVITADEYGRPLVSGDWIAVTDGVAPVVSIAHVSGTAVALAGSGRLRGIGIDLEHQGRMAPETSATAFAPSELVLLEVMDASVREAWALRMWCAKEASAKATGLGMAGGPMAFAVQGIDDRNGGVSVRVQQPGRAPLDVRTCTVQDGTWVLAACVLPEERSS
jgi:acyl transferase domain-containing protein/phosphopantetheinyl transferase